MNKAIVDYTSPALCTPVTPIPPTGDAAYHQLPEEDRATDMGNMHKRYGKYRACGSGDILADRQTHRQTYSSQYFATAPADEVIIRCYCDATVLSTTVGLNEYYRRFCDLPAASSE